MRGIKRLWLLGVTLLLVAVMLPGAVLSAASDKPLEIYLFGERVSQTGSFSGIETPKDATLFDVKEAEAAEADTADGDGEKKPDRVGVVPAADSGTVKEMTHGGRSYYSCSPAKDATSVKLTFSMKDREAALASGKLGIGLFVVGFSDSESAVVTVRLTVTDKDDTYTMAMPVVANTAVCIFGDYSPSKDGIDSISLSVAPQGDIDLKNVRVTEPYLTAEHDFTFQKDQRIAWLSVLEGSVELKADGMEAATGKSSVVVAIGNEAVGESRAQNVGYAAVGLSSGTASVSASSVNESAESEELALTARSGESAAVLRVAKGIRDGVEVTLRNSTSENVTVDELGIYATSEPAKSDVRPFTTLTLVDGKLHGEGRIDSETSKAYRKGYLGIFMTRADGGGEPIQIAKLNVSPKYTFDISLDAYPHAVSDYMFYAAVVDSDGTSMQVSDKRFVAGHSVQDSAKALYGLYGVDPVSVYESASPRVMVDVDISKLTDTETSNSIAMSRGGYVFGINSDYLKEIDAHMEFYRTTDVGVYVRLVCTAPINSSVTGHHLTYRWSGGEMMIRPDDPEGANLYMALGSFLCTRYPGIVSFVLGSGANSDESTGHISVDPYKSASDVALAARLLYGAASEVSDVLITIPLATEAKTQVASAEVFGVLMAERFSHLGQIPWAILLTDDRAELPTLGDSIVTAQRFNEMPPAAFTVYCWEPTDGEDIIGTYIGLCADSGSNTARLVFLSERGLDSALGRGALNELKHKMKSDSTLIIDGEAVVMNDDELAGVKGSAYLWDFSSANSKLGWIAGYGLDHFSSAKEGGLSSDSGNRVLRGITEHSDESIAGIMLCRRGIPLNLAEASLVEFVYSHRSNAPVQIVFVFGNGESRAEYTVAPDVTAGADGKYRAVCDLSEFSGTLGVAYVGIIIYSSESVSFELSSVRAMSRTLTDGEVESLVAIPTEEETSGISGVRMIIAVLIVLIVLAIAGRVLAVTRRYDRTLVNVVKRRRRYHR